MPEQHANALEQAAQLRGLDSYFERQFKVNLDTLDLEARTVEVAVSSEYEVRRWYGVEILDHTPGAIRMQRMQHGAAVLDNHHHLRQVGVVLDFRLDQDKRTRAVLKFSRRQEAEDMLQDIADGIRTHVSVGYLVHKRVLEREQDGVEFFRVTDWEPFEVSMVSVPADPSVGVGRSLNPKGEKQMSEQATTGGQAASTGGAAADTRTQAAPAQAPVVEVDHVALRREEAGRQREIRAIGERVNMDARDIEAAIDRGDSVDSFRALAWDRMPAPEPAGSGARDDDGLATERAGVGSLGITERDLQDYSIMRAINAMASKNWKKAGKEREINVAIADAVGKEARGLYLPHAVLAMRASEDYLALRAGLDKSAGKGAELVATDLLDMEFIKVLRARAKLGLLGARMLPGLVGDADIPKQTAGANFYWLSGANDDDVTDSDFDLTTVPLTPKTVAGALPVSRRMRKQSSLGVEQLMSNDLLNGIAVALDYQAINGDGTGNLPTGILNQSGVNSTVIPVGGIDWASIVEMETKVASANADENTRAYLTSPTERGTAKTTLKVSGDAGAGFLWRDDGTVNGYRAEVSTNVPAAQSPWIYGDWSQLVFGFWGVTDLTIDEAAKAASGGLVVRAFQDVDVANRQAAAFTIGKKA